MFRIFVCLFPILINFILFAVFYNTDTAITKAGYGAIHVTLIPAVWALSYALVSPVMGKITTERNAAKLIALAVILETVLMGFFAFTECVLWKQYLLVALMGCAIAIYCTPMQVFMRAVEQGNEGGAVRSTGFYTFAWSFGSGLGPFFMSRLSMRAGYLTSGGIGLCLAAGVLLLNAWYKRTSVKPQPLPSSTPAPAKAVTDYSQYPDLAKMGWGGAIVGVLAVYAVRMLVPYQVEKLGMSKAISGNATAVFSFTIAFLALLLTRTRTWMFRPLPLAAALASGLSGMLLLALSEAPLLIYAGVLLFGCYCAVFYFQLVFYSMVHPTKSTKYISINELTVAIATAASGLTGLLVKSGSPTLLFLVCGGAIALMMLAEVITTARLSHNGK